LKNVQNEVTLNHMLDLWHITYLLSWIINCFEHDLVLLEDDFELINNRTFTGIFPLSNYNFSFNAIALADAGGSQGYLKLLEFGRNIQPPAGQLRYGGQQMERDFIARYCRDK